MKVCPTIGSTGARAASFLTYRLCLRRLAKMGEKETKTFYRFYLVPGMFHCTGGVGCNTVDWLTAMVDWVEKGKAPEYLLGAQVEGGATKRTRPLCPYPQVARYKGAGSIEAAENFICVRPENAEKK